MSNEKYWWDLPLVVCTDGAMDNYSIQELLELAMNGKTTDGDFNLDAMEVVAADFTDDAEFCCTMGVPSIGKPRVVLVKNAPDNWDTPEFEEHLLTEWADEGDPDTVYLALLPLPAPALMELDEFWVDQVLCYDYEVDDLEEARVFTRHGWVIMNLKWVEECVSSIGVHNLDPLEEDGDVIIKYRAEPSVPGPPLWTI